MDKRCARVGFHYIHTITKSHATTSPRFVLSCEGWNHCSDIKASLCQSCVSRRPASETGSDISVLKVKTDHSKPTYGSARETKATSAIKMSTGTRFAVAEKGIPPGTSIRKRVPACKKILYPSSLSGRALKSTHFQTWRIDNWTNTLRAAIYPWGASTCRTPRHHLQRFKADWQTGQREGNIYLKAQEKALFRRFPMEFIIFVWQRKILDRDLGGHRVGASQPTMRPIFKGSERNFSLQAMRRL